MIPIVVSNEVEYNHQLLKLFILCKKEQPKHLKYSCQTNQLSIENYKRKLEVLLRAASCSQKAIYSNNFREEESFLFYIYIYKPFFVSRKVSSRGKSIKEKRNCEWIILSYECYYMKYSKGWGYSLSHRKLFIVWSNTWLR